MLSVPQQDACVGKPVTRLAAPEKRSFSSSTRWLRVAGGGFGGKGVAWGSGWAAEKAARSHGMVVGAQEG